MERKKFLKSLGFIALAFILITQIACSQGAISQIKKNNDDHNPKEILTSDFETISVEELQTELGNQNTKIILLSEDFAYKPNLTIPNNNKIYVFTKNRKNGQEKLVPKYLPFIRKVNGLYEVEGLNPNELLVKNPLETIQFLARKNRTQLTNMFLR